MTERWCYTCKTVTRWRPLHCDAHGLDCKLWVCVACGDGLEEEAMGLWHTKKAL